MAAWGRSGLKGTRSNHDQKNVETMSAEGERLPANRSRKLRRGRPFARGSVTVTEAPSGEGGVVRCCLAGV